MKIKKVNQNETTDEARTPKRVAYFYKCSPDIWIILGCLSQMERELIRARVVAGLQNARAKGKKIGRERKRNDALIHQLLSAQLSFREIARIAKCSHGSVSASKKEWLAKKAAEEAAAKANETADSPITTSSADTPNDPANSTTPTTT